MGSLGSLKAIFTFPDSLRLLTHVLAVVALVCWKRTIFVESIEKLVRLKNRVDIAAR